MERAALFVSIAALAVGLWSGAASHSSARTAQAALDASERSATAAERSAETARDVATSNAAIPVLADVRWEPAGLPQDEGGAVEDDYRLRGDGRFIVTLRNQGRTDTDVVTFRFTHHVSSLPWQCSEAHRRDVQGESAGAPLIPAGGSLELSVDPRDGEPIYDGCAVEEVDGGKAYDLDVVFGNGCVLSLPAPGVTRYPELGHRSSNWTWDEPADSQLPVTADCSRA